MNNSDKLELSDQILTHLCESVKSDKAIKFDTTRDLRTQMSLAKIWGQSNLLERLQGD